LETESAGLILQLTPRESLLWVTSFWEISLGLGGILCLLIASALVSGSEIAYFSLSPNDRERLEQDDKSSNQRILWLINQPEKLLATILISNNFINIAIVLLSAIVTDKMVPSATTVAWAEAWQQAWSWLAAYPAETIGKLIYFGITVVGVTFLLVLFGEVTPKVYATINSVGLARLMSGPLSLLMQLFSFFSEGLVSWSHRMEHRLSTKQTGVGMTSKEDIGEAIELTVSMEEDSAQDLDILKRIIKFSEVTVTQVMRARVDVVAVNEHDDYGKVLETIRDSGYSRFPVYEHDADNVIGILYAKDLLNHLQEARDFYWQNLIRTNVLFVPESKKINDLLRDFQLQRLHLAIVVDEYGGTMGIVTLEDVLEEVIGEIQDEFDDEPEVVYQKIDDYNYIFEGKTLLNDVCRIVGLDIDAFDNLKGEAESIAGLILEWLGHMPKQDQELQLPNVRLRTLVVSKRRIEKVRLTVLQEE
jgi:gliding motility-associated protein GldE